MIEKKFMCRKVLYTICCIDVGFYLGPGTEDDIIIDYPMFVKCVELAYSIYREKNGRNEQIEKDIEGMHHRYGV